MQADRFSEVTFDQIDHCLDVLETKSAEYSFSGDRLEHFKNSAAEQDINPKQALWGMASKHFVSINGMCKADLKAKDLRAKNLWREKITDSLNYLFLLWALVEEETENANRH
jgi:hypothetical protein